MFSAFFVVFCVLIGMFLYFSIKVPEKSIPIWLWVALGSTVIGMSSGGGSDGYRERVEEGILEKPSTEEPTKVQQSYCYGGQKEKPKTWSLKV